DIKRNQIEYILKYGVDATSDSFEFKISDKETDMILSPNLPELVSFGRLVGNGRYLSQRIKAKVTWAALARLCRVMMFGHLVLSTKDSVFASKQGHTG
ncbi:hypothetical protein BaRGS_00025796, partial [Batillaria attramentaria]